jgi:PIN domain nuclease of toxin-antitoxin system
MTNILVDTHVLLWALGEPKRLSPDARTTLEDSHNEVFVSAVSAWEISVKAALGRVRAPQDLATGVRSLRFVPVDVTFADGLAVRQLPEIHRDPFDRMLIARCLERDLVLMTNDERIPRYAVATTRA